MMGGGSPVGRMTEKKVKCKTSIYLISLVHHPSTYRQPTQHRCGFPHQRGCCTFQWNLSTISTHGICVDTDSPRSISSLRHVLTATSNIPIIYKKKSSSERCADQIRWICKYAKQQNEYANMLCKMNMQICCAKWICKCKYNKLNSEIVSRQ